MSSLDFIMDVEENGFDLDNEDHVAGIEEMIQSGLCWQLQGFWGRLANAYLQHREG